MSVVRGRTARSRAAAFRKACRQVGDAVQIDGHPTIVEWFGGHIEIGDRFRFSSSPVPSHMYSAGILRIGNDVSIAHGAAIAATRSVEIGDRTQIGPFLLLMDTDFHGERARPGARATINTAVTADSGYAPIWIGADVRIGPQVTVLRGSTIGDGATIAPGSVVNGRIAPGAYAAGVPARSVDRLAAGETAAARSVDAAQVAARVFGLSSTPSSDATSYDIPEWDSLGSLKLLLALEEAIGKPLDTEAFAKAVSIADVQRVIDPLLL